MILPENILKCLSPAERAKLGPSGQTATEAQQRWQTREERLIHDEVITWLRMKGIPFIHPRMDKPSTIKKGWPDFTCMVGYPAPRGLLSRTYARVCCVELKAPGGILSESQAECIAELTAAHVPVCVATSAKEAVDFIIAELLT